MRFVHRDHLRISLKVFAAGVVLFVLSPRASAGTMRAEAPAGEGRPNILWITCEDASANLGCYGDAYARTPTLDVLASKGVRYSSAFGVTGVCAPNRSCLITGVYPTSLGSHDMRSTTRLPANIKCFTEYLRSAGYYCTNNAKTDYNFPTPRTAWDECSSKGHWRNRKPGQPFFAVFNYVLTHESKIRQPDREFFQATSRLKPGERHDPAEVPVPPYHPDTPEVRKDWARYHDLITALDYRVADRLRELADDGLADDTIVFFFSDHGAGMPGCKKWVWHPGLHVPLIIRFPPGFQRWAPGPPGSLCGRLVSFVDFAPTILSLAGVKIPGHMQGVAFLGEHAGKPRTYVYAHRDRMAERYDTIRVARNARYQYLRNFMPHRSWSQYVSYTEEMPTMRIWRQLAVTDRLSGPPARYFQPTKPVEELYDTASDPHSIHNLAGDPKYRAILEELRRACVAWMEQTRDLGLQPEYDVHRRASGSTPWEMGHDPDHNPVGRLLRAADAANAMAPANLPMLVEMLEADEPAVRWWGALGLAALGKKAEPASGPLSAALEDSAPNVRVAAAEAVCNLGRMEKALPVLQEALKHPTPFIRLRALNVLDRLGEKARPVLPEIRKAPMKSKDHPHVATYVDRIVLQIDQRLSK